jgi:hypothetical protein
MWFFILEKLSNGFLFWKKILSGFLFWKKNYVVFSFGTNELVFLTLVVILKLLSQPLKCYLLTLLPYCSGA